MRYIKPPTQLSQLWWVIGKAFPIGQKRLATKPHGDLNVEYILDYINTESDKEYILDVRVFSSVLITALLDL